MSIALANPSAEQFSKPALQVFLRREGDRVHQDVQLAPVRPDAVEYRLQLAGHGNVQCAGDRGVEFLCQWFDMRPCPFVQPGDREVRADGAKRLRAAVRDRLVIGDADDERLLSGKDLPDVSVAHQESPSAN